MGCGTGKSAGRGSSAKIVPEPPAEIKTHEAGAGVSHGTFILDNTGVINDFYHIEKKKIGEGSYGFVQKATNKATKATRAVKTMRKAQLQSQGENTKFQREITIMKLMDHPNIIKLYETFDDKKNIYLVMELCTGGELFDRIIDTGHFTEVQAAMLMRQMFRAMYYMHESQVTHRDLKPENFLFINADPLERCLLKIIDFGLSCKFGPKSSLTTKAGTPYYVAPQVLTGSYNETADLWSCGVIMFVMLCGYPPFYGETDADVLTKVRLGNFTFNAADWQNVSDDAKHLIRHLLKMNPSDRYTAEQALNHVWVKNKAPKGKGVALGAGLVDKLRSFRGQNKLKKAALHIIAGQLGEDKIKQLREIFVELDDNGDGMLTSEEVRQGLGKAGMSEIPPDLQQIMEDVDADGSGAIDYTEFLAASLDKKAYIQEDVCWAAFRVFDKNGDGKITKDEIEAVIGSEDVCENAQAIADLMKEVDTDGDGEIDFQEFLAMMRAS